MTVIPVTVPSTPLGPRPNGSIDNGRALVDWNESFNNIFNSAFNNSYEQAIAIGLPPELAAGIATVAARTAVGQNSSGTGSDRRTGITGKTT